MKHSTIILIALAALLAMAGCRRGTDTAANEDRQAKQMLQGIWMDDENENAVFWVRGDSIFYPDSTSQPAKFWVSRATPSSATTRLPSRPLTSLSSSTRWATR